jgi:hypothetical protein
MVVVAEQFTEKYLLISGIKIYCDKDWSLSWTMTRGGGEDQVSAHRFLEEKKLK